MKGKIIGRKVKKGEGRSAQAHAEESKMGMFRILFWESSQEICMKLW